jgi:hypothetical protein
MPKKNLLLSGIILSIVLLASCATSLDSIKSKPEIYAGSDVLVKAEVTLKIPIPFLDYSVYKIDDGTDEMFLFTVRTYRTGEIITASVHVIGITEKGSEKKAAAIQKDTADFLVKKKIAEPDEASKISKKIYQLVTTFGGLAEGSYFLMGN